MSPTISPSAQGQKGLNAVIWQYVGTFGRAIATFLFGVLLARLLGPKPFATVAVAQSFIGLAGLLADFGMTTALVQRKTLDNQTISFVFTLQVLISIALVIIFASLSPILAHTFHLDSWQPLAVISLVFFFQSIGQTSSALLRRDLRFKELNITQLVAYVLGYGVIGLILALKGAGVWALVVAQLMQALIASLVYSYLIRPSIRLTLHTSDSQLIGFSGIAAASNIVSWGISNLPTLMIGKIFGPTALAQYNRASMTAGVPLTNIVSVLQTVLLSLYSRHQGNPQRLSSLYTGSLGIVSTIIFPVFGILAVLAWPLTYCLFGSKWAGIEPLMAFLLLVMPFDAVAALTSPLLIGLGEPQRDFLGQVLTLLISSVLVSSIVFIFHPTLLQLVAAIAICVYLVRALVLVNQATRLVKLDAREMGGIAAFCVSATASACLLTYLGRQLVLTDAPLIQLCTGGAVGGIGFLGFLLLTRQLWKSKEGVQLILAPIGQRFPPLRRLLGI